MGKSDHLEKYLEKYYGLFLVGLIVVGLTYLGVSSAVFKRFYSPRQCANVPTLGDVFLQEQAVNKMLVSGADDALTLRKALLESHMGACTQRCEAAFCVDPAGIATVPCKESSTTVASTCSSVVQCISDCEATCFTGTAGPTACFARAVC